MFKRHHDILASAAIVKYAIDHAPHGTVVKLYEMDKSNERKPEHGHKVELMKRAVVFHGIGTFNGTYKWIKKSDNFFLKLHAAVWACDAHWSEERPAFWSAANKCW